MGGGGGGEPDVAVCYHEQSVVGQNFEPRWLGSDPTHRYIIGSEWDEMHEWEQWTKRKVKSPKPEF